MKNLEKRLLIVLIIFSVLFYFFQTKKYNTTISVYPDYGDQLDTGLLDIASSFGIGKGLNSSSPVIYAPDIVQSFDLREKILLKEYEALNGSTYFDYLQSREWFFKIKMVISKNIFGKSSDEIKEETIYNYAKKLKNNIGVEIERISGLVTLSISIKSIKNYDITYELSEEIRDFVLTYLENFINQATREKALVKIRYVDDRLSDVKSTLSDKEDKLKRFLISNKEIDSPLLQTEYLRLSREVELSNTVYVLLTKEVETEKLKTVQNELNFIITDKHENPKPIKYRLRQIITLDILLIFSYYLFWRRRKDFTSFFTSN
jgi:capsule polysaccharide export protein KpsE/RkpR